MRFLCYSEMKYINSVNVVLFSPQRKIRALFVPRRLKIYVQKHQGTPYFGAHNGSNGDKHRNGQVLQEGESWVVCSKPDNGAYLNPQS